MGPMHVEAARTDAMNVGTPEKFFLYRMVQSEQAKTRKADFCRRATCSHPRASHRDGRGECEFALVCQCPEYTAG